VPITISLEEIKIDIIDYANRFPTETIPHITDSSEIIDPIHNYRHPKPNESAFQQRKTVQISDFVDTETTKVNNALTYGRPTLTEEIIQVAKHELQDHRTSKLIGLIAHLAYWNVFGHLNELPLD